MESEMQDKIEIEDHGVVTVIAINRPAQRNAVDPETATLLDAAFTAFEADDGKSVAILTGRGPTFCAGFDLKAVSRGDFTYEPEGRGPMGPTRRLLSKPVIAAVEGYAVAGGLELALWCDMRVASASAVFGVFCRRWGVPLIDGGNVRLPRLIGHSRAMDMILTGRPVAADEAHQFGLINRLVSEGTALEEALALAQVLARFPQTCLRTDRMTAHRQWGLTLEDALCREGIEGALPLAEDAVIGAGRFSSGLGRSGDFDRI